MYTRKISSRLLPATLICAIVILDQLTKWWISVSIPINTVGMELWGDFLKIIHVRNLGIAFSIGESLPSPFRQIFFILLPLLVIVFLSLYLVRTKELSQLSRWSMAGIMGGGIGNIIDRIFRSTGVVDFLDFKFYGLFGLNRFPTFNIADASVVVCSIILLISLAIEEGRRRRYLRRGGE